MASNQKSKRTGRDDRSAASEVAASLERGVRDGSRRPNTETDPRQARPPAKGSSKPGR